MTLQELYDALGDLINAGVYPGNAVEMPECDGYGNIYFNEVSSVALEINIDTRKRVVRIS